MNPKDFKDFLDEIDTKYVQIQFHPAMLPELQNYVLARNYSKRFFRALIAKLDLLTELGYKAIKHQDFEKLKDAEGLWSMKFKSSEYNIRILYSLTADNECMLHLFEERQGKRNTSYENHIPIAMQRKKEMEELK